jgi:hypothetical protein
MNTTVLAVAAAALLAGMSSTAAARECGSKAVRLSTPAAAATPARALAAVGDAEGSRVIAVVSSIPLAVDLARYDLAEAAFAPRVVIDYTSLWGGQPNTMTPTALMDAWRGIVPGFTATWHELSDVQANVLGDKATATAFVDGRHWIDDQLWRPVGHYHWDLEKQAGQWKVTRMVFTITQETGDRRLAALAMERAKAVRVAAR